MKYKLGDLTVKDWNNWDRVPRDPATVGSAIFTALGLSTTAGITIAGYTLAYSTIAGYLVTTAITSWAISALTPKPDFSSSNSAGLQVNAREPAAAAQFVYGKVRKGGTVTYYETTGEDNKFLHQFIVLAAHEVEDIGDIYINDKKATISAGLVTEAVDPDDAGNIDNWASKIYVTKFIGASGQNILTTLSGISDKPTLKSGFTGSNIACLYVRYEYDQDVFTNGVPLITAVVEGKKVYDPRTSTTSYSNNPALCIRDFLTSEYGLSDDAIDDTVFAAAANECDESVTLADASTQNRYEMNGVISSATSKGDVLQQMMTSCAGTLFWGMGSWKLKVGAYSSSTKSLGLDDFRGPINLTTRISMNDNFNTIRGTFNDADNYWVTGDYPEITSETFVTEDGGETVPLDLELPFTTSSAMAQRLAKLTLHRGREQMTLTADFGLEAFDIEVGDIIDITNSRYGWTNKEFEVVGWKLSNNQDAGDLRVNLTLRETSSAAFDWDAEETAIIYNNSTLPSPFTTPTVGIELTAEPQTFAEKVGNKLKINITSNSEFAIDRVEVQLKYSGAKESIIVEKLPNALLRAAVNLEPELGLFETTEIDGRPLGDIDDNGVVISFDALQMQAYVEGSLTNQTYIDYIEDVMFPYMLANPSTYSEYVYIQAVTDADYRNIGEGRLGVFEYADAPTGRYDVRARAINIFGRAGDWSYYTDFTLDDTLPIPDDVQKFNADITDNSLTLSWQAVNTIDLSYYVIRHTPETSGAVWSDSTIAIAKVGRPSTDVTLPARTGTYMIKAVSKSNKESLTATSVVITSDQLQPFTTTLSQQEHSTFSGTKTYTTVVGGALELNSTGYSYPYYKDASGDEPSYVFSTDIDASADRRVFCRVDAVTDRRDLSSGLFDDLQGNFDSLTGLFDDLTGAANFGDTDVEFYIAIKPDGGSFGDYQKFRSGYYYGRYFRFKVEPKTRSVNITPSISSLTAYVEYN